MYQPLVVCVARDVTQRSAEHAVACYYLLATAEASSNLARYDGVRYGPRVEGDGSLAGMMSATRAAGFGDDKRTTKTVERLITLYDSWHAAEPGKGYDANAAEWRAKLPEEVDEATP